MKGFLDLFVLFILLAVLIPFLLFGPDMLKVRIQGQYLVNVKSLIADDTLISLLASTNNDYLDNGNKKPTLEIIGEKILIAEQNLDFLKEDLDILIKSKCYIFDAETVTLIDNCPDLRKTDKSNFRKIVLPFNPNKLVEGIKLMVK